MHQLLYTAYHEASWHTPSTNDLISIIEASCLAHRFHDLQYAHALALAEVIRLVPRVGRAAVKSLRVIGQRVERQQMPTRKVQNVQIISDTCAVSVRPSGISGSMGLIGIILTV